MVPHGAERGVQTGDRLSIFRKALRAKASFFHFKDIIAECIRTPLQQARLLARIS